MKKIPNLILAVMLLCCAGCASSSLTIVDKKPPTMPYSKVLVVYVEEPCDFTLFDSLTYDICLKSCFLKGDNFAMRSQVEDLLRHQLTTATAIVRSSDVLDMYNNSYGYFRHMIDSLHIDALLMVNFRRYSQTKHRGPGATKYPANSNLSYGASIDYTTLNAGYVCYLIKTSSINFPIWTAELGTKGHIGAGKLQLNMKMAKTLAASLKKDGYWMH